MIVAIIQARTGSSRLPNKVLKELCGKPLIWHIINRLKASRRIEKIVLATTLSSKDDILEKWAHENGVLCFRGDEQNVLDRYFQAAMYYSADTIVRITADDPFKDPDIIDEVIDMFLKEKLDFAYNNNPPTFPEGLDTEVFSMKSLGIAAANSTDNFEKEHVTQYFYRNPAKFKQGCLKYSTNLSYLRWTIDTEDDWRMVESVYSRLFYKKNVFRMSDILELIKEEPHIAEINMSVQRSAMYKMK